MLTKAKIFYDRVNVVFKYPFFVGQKVLIYESLVYMIRKAIGPDKLNNNRILIAYAIQYNRNRKDFPIARNDNK